MRRVAVLVIGLTLCGPTAAGISTGGEVQAWCKDIELDEPLADGQETSACVAFLAGVWGAAHLLGILGYRNNIGEPLGYCMPDGVSMRQMHEVWLHYARENPDDLQLPAAVLVLTAFEKVWPCRR